MNRCHPSGSRVAARTLVRYLPVMGSSKVERYRYTLASLRRWEPYLLEESGLSGPHVNLELGRAVALEGDRALFDRLVEAACPVEAPSNSREEFLAICGVLGLGRLWAEGDSTSLTALRLHANDPRRRVREAVVIGLQWLAERHFNRLLQQMKRWARDGSWLERHAAAAALCEPGLLAQASHVKPVLCLLDELTASILAATDRRDDGFTVLRQGLGHAWSVAVVAAPEPGKRYLEKWMRVQDEDIQWVMHENLKQPRLRRLDPTWVDTLATAVQGRGTR